MKSWLCENINKIDKPLARLTKKKRRNKLPISRMKQGITTDPTDIKRVIKECHKQPYTHEFDNSDEVDYFVKKLTQFT